MEQSTAEESGGRRHTQRRGTCSVSLEALPWNVSSERRRIWVPQCPQSPEQSWCGGNAPGAV